MSTEKTNRIRSAGLILRFSDTLSASFALFPGGSMIRIPLL